MSWSIFIPSDYGDMNGEIETLYVEHDNGAKFLVDNNGDIAALLLTKDDEWEPYNVHGEPMYIAVAMRKYRGYAPQYSAQASLQTTLSNAGLALYTSRSGVSMSSTEEQLDSCIAYDKPYQTSEEMTTIWLTAFPNSRAVPSDYGYTKHVDAAAAKFCRDCVLKHFGPMDLPRPEILARIWQKRSYIESVDTTVNDVKVTWGYTGAYNGGTFNLNKWYIDNGANNGYTYLWTSALGISLALNGSMTAYGYHYGGLMIVPVKEIPASSIPH